MEDLETARVVLEMGRYYASAFFSHQAAELPGESYRVYRRHDIAYILGEVLVQAVEEDKS